MPDREHFPFVAGCLSLCFVDTLGGRAGTRVERIGDAGSFAAWLGAAGLLPDAGAQPDAGDAEEARALREAIYRAARGAMQGRGVEATDAERINAAALSSPPRPQLASSGTCLVATSPVSAALSAIAADAIDAIGRPERLRECPDCRMLFLDTSRPGRRRWCSSTAGCGNRAKVRNHRARRARQASTGE